MTTADFDSEELYVCAGICRIDYQTNTCIGCGRPLVETTPTSDAGEDVIRQRDAMRLPDKLED